MTSPTPYRGEDQVPDDALTPPAPADPPRVVSGPQLTLAEIAEKADAYADQTSTPDVLKFALHNLAMLVREHVSAPSYDSVALARSLLQLGWSTMVEPLPELVAEAARMIDEAQRTGLAAARAEVAALTAALEQANRERDALRSIHRDCELAEERARGVVAMVERRAEHAEAQVLALDVSLRNLAKGVTNRPWEGGPPALKALPDLEGLRLVEQRIEHLGHLQHRYIEDVGALRGWFRRAMRLLRARALAAAPSGTRKIAPHEMCTKCGETPADCDARWAKIVATPDFDPEGAPTPCDHVAGETGGREGPVPLVLSDSQIRDTPEVRDLLKAAGRMLVTPSGAAAPPPAVRDDHGRSLSDMLDLMAVQGSRDPDPRTSAVLRKWAASLRRWATPESAEAIEARLQRMAGPPAPAATETGIEPPITGGVLFGPAIGPAPAPAAGDARGEPVPVDGCDGCDGSGYYDDPANHAAGGAYRVECLNLAHWPSAAPVESGAAKEDRHA